MATGISSKPSGVIRGAPPGITTSSTVTDILNAAVPNFIYLWGGWANPAYAPLTDASHQWSFILFKTTGDAVLNYHELIAICNDNATTISSGTFIYNYTSAKWLKIYGSYNKVPSTITDEWALSCMCNGGGLLVPITNERGFTITSAKVYLNNTWKSLSVAASDCTIRRGQLQTLISFTNLVSQNIEVTAGNSYLVAISGTFN